MMGEGGNQKIIYVDFHIHVPADQRIINAIYVL